jgi:NAD(P)-dependent dehydrogenase (short-subunit alcohol dehydrogenase family)
MGLTEEQYENFKDAFTHSIVPMDRPGTAEEMAKTIFFLATDATYMTGANIVADGGCVNFTPMPKMK